MSPKIRSLWIAPGVIPPTCKTGLTPEQIISKLELFAKIHGLTIAKVVHRPDGSKQVTVELP